MPSPVINRQLGAIAGLSLAAKAQLADWLTRINAASGSIPGIGQLRSVGKWYDRVNKNIGISLVKVFDPIVFVSSGNATLDATTAGVPFIKNTGNDAWVRNGSATGMITSAGFVGDTTRQYDTGITPTNLHSSDTSAACFIYMTLMTTSAVFEMGSFSTGGGGACYQLSTNFTDNKLRFDSWQNNDANGETQVTSPNKTGFYLASRTASNDTRIFFANSTNAWAQQGATNTGAGSIGTRYNNNSIRVGSSVTTGGTPISITDRSIGCIGWADGLTSAQGQALYNATQSLMAAFNRAT